MKLFQALMLSAARKGYVYIPLKLLEWLTKDKKLSTCEAFILMVAKVNFKDNELKVKDRKRTCRRGESIRSVENWSEMFGWKPRETVKFFEELRQYGALEEIDNPISVNHIRIANYEQLTGRMKEEHEPSLFDDFWELFHQITGMKPAEKARARKKWDDLTEEQQNKAVEGIQAYYDSLTDKKFCRKAATFLERESFA